MIPKVRVDTCTIHDRPSRGDLKDDTVRALRLQVAASGGITDQLESSESESPGMVMVVHDMPQGCRCVIG